MSQTLRLRLQKALLARNLRSEPGLPVWKRKKRPYRAGCRHRGKTVDTIRQKHPLSFTRYADKLCSCFAISDGLLPTNLVGHVCSAQLSDRVDQLGISPGSHRCRRPGRKRPYSGGRCKQGRTMPVIVTDRPQIGSFTLSTRPLMTLSNLPQISAVQHVGYLILT